MLALMKGDEGVNLLEKSTYGGLLVNGIRYKKLCFRNKSPICPRHFRPCGLIRYLIKLATLN